MPQRYFQAAAAASQMRAILRLRYHPPMMLLPSTRRFGRKVAASLSKLSNRLPVEPPMEASPSPVLKTVGWLSAAAGALALGLVVGREIRLRYKFNRRTPYDFYAHSGDERDIDFGIGI